MTPPLNWQTIRLRIPAECDGMHCHHALIAAGETAHALPDADHPGESIILCESCFRTGNQPPEPTPGTGT